MGSVRIRPEAEIRPAARATFEEQRRRVLELVPEAEVEHVGSTSIPGALTKGDVDLLVRVQAEGFGGAILLLRLRYAIHQPENWTATLASFVDARAGEPPVGVQLVVADSADDDLFGPFRDALIRDPGLLAEYNTLKRHYDGEDYRTYTDIKGEFVERVLARLRRSSA